MHPLSAVLRCLPADVAFVHVRECLRFAAQHNRRAHDWIDHPGDRRAEIERALRRLLERSSRSAMAHLAQAVLAYADAVNDHAVDGGKAFDLLEVALEEAAKAMRRRVRAITWTLADEEEVRVQRAAIDAAFRMLLGDR